MENVPGIDARRPRRSHGGHLSALAPRLAARGRIQSTPPPCLTLPKNTPGDQPVRRRCPVEQRLAEECEQRPGCRRGEMPPPHDGRSRSPPLFSFPAQLPASSSSAMAVQTHSRVIYHKGGKFLKRAVPCTSISSGSECWSSLWCPRAVHSRVTLMCKCPLHTFKDTCSDRSHNTNPADTSEVCGGGHVPAGLQGTSTLPPPQATGFS